MATISSSSHRFHKPPRTQRSVSSLSAFSRRSSSASVSTVHSRRRSRSSSIISSSEQLSEIPPCPITFEDHTEHPGANSGGLWARHAKVEDYSIVSGSRTRAGAYVVWNCRIETFEGAQFTVRKRYSEFWELREQLKGTFPRSLEYLPQLPPKSTFSRFRPKFLEARRQGLSYFLNVVLLNPEFAGSPAVKDFLLK